MKLLKISRTPRQVLSFAAEGEIRILLEYNGTAKAWFFNFTRNGIDIVTGSKLTQGINLLSGRGVGSLVVVNTVDRAASAGYEEVVSGNAAIYYTGPLEVERILNARIA